LRSTRKKATADGRKLPIAGRIPPSQPRIRREKMIEAMSASIMYDWGLGSDEPAMRTGAEAPVARITTRSWRRNGASSGNTSAGAK
jgi:hypothetical protein